MTVARQCNTLKNEKLQYRTHFKHFATQSNSMWAKCGNKCLRWVCDIQIMGVLDRLNCVVLMMMMMMNYRRWGLAASGWSSCLAKRPSSLQSRSRRRRYRPHPARRQSHPHRGRTREECCAHLRNTKLRRRMQTTSGRDECGKKQADVYRKYPGNSDILELTETGTGNNKLKEHWNSNEQRWWRLIGSLVMKLKLAKRRIEYKLTQR